MDSQHEIDFNRIERAITYIRENFREQPSLEDIAEWVHLSPYHFQKMFKAWAGVSPKKFLQFTTIGYAKKMLREKSIPLPDVVHNTGLSGTGRLHDLFITIEGMTPAEYRDGGSRLTINYSFTDTPFGRILIASTPKGICYLVFSDHEVVSLQDLYNEFPEAIFRSKTDVMQESAKHFFSGHGKPQRPVNLHIKGTGFQLKIWEALLSIPEGALSSYETIAHKAGKKKAARAAGNAIGKNPVAILIPCHRVIRASGMTGGYRWGNNRKIAIIGWEAAHKNNTP
ncbi:AraC family transcriptional regulator, regulatory protein of adaptative response / methylated-DNA-[protein]-cysteine methyltransferase [Sinomicrobium oceani]|uniref:methylated-DNA--[protein]-cysteine S-methyltransferase n=1 Tax=Sinomicrobium oceani TaxID=1150368 RepID=A0A1K1RCM0_9FLAO|nr:methylated-DNA--[protein]-cysteine S-methyltransferase [Sinomicrobium oceani]SFW69697.1 AraC family transcriptional regulator, regulatory protein of adaptative response / methylated-DNA-[protein]-cysteine methyltransferase [Sinomicrobium oceani]